MGLEPTTSELEVQRAIRCATAAMMSWKTQILSNPNDILSEKIISLKNLVQTTVTISIAKSFRIQSHKKMVSHVLKTENRQVK